MVVSKWASILNDPKQPLKARFRALFALKNVPSAESVRAICDCFKDDSALLKHELAYCLGQMGSGEATDFLINVLQNQHEDTMVRHEAGEALGAIGDVRVLDVLYKHSNDDKQEVAETCQLAVDRIKWVSDKANAHLRKTTGGFESIDPAPPCECQDVEKLGSVLVDEQCSLWDRYRSMFALRNINSDEAVTTLAKGLNCEGSALFRHEIAYVLGQMQSNVCIDQLASRLSLSRENYMVRHECAEALGSIGGDRVTEILKPFLEDEERVVRESVLVALDMADYENDQQFNFTESL